MKLSDRLHRIRLNFSAPLIISAILVLAAVSATPAQNANQGVATPLFVLDLDAMAQGGPIVLTRPESGIISIKIIYSGQAGTTALVETSQFSSDNGSVAVDILADCGNSKSKRAQPVTVKVPPTSTLPLCLSAEPLLTTAKYTGRLIISSPGVPSMIRAISLIQPPVPQGTLVLDHNAVARTLSRSWWPPFAGGQTECSVTLREKSGNIVLQGVTVRLEQVSGSPASGFDLENNVHFRLNDEDAPDLNMFPPRSGNASSRTIAAGSQSKVTMALHDLMPGDYAAVLRFTAGNSAADDAQKLQMNIHVRDSVGWAVAWLVIAVLISFVGTKVLTSQRRRASLLQQIRLLQPQWLSAQPPVSPVIWARAVLHRAQRLSRQFWLTSPDLIEASVSSVKSVLGLLDSARQLREKLQMMLDWLVFRRATLALDRVVSRFGTAELDDATLKSINLDLDGLNDWLSADKFPSTFWKDITPTLQALQAEMADVDVPESAREVIAELKAAIVASLSNPPTNRADVEKVYQQYAILRVLWDQRHEADALLGSAKSNLLQFLELADDLAWKRLKDQRLKIRTPNVGDPAGLEAYQVLEFSVEAPDPSLNHSYLFRHKIEYHWVFELKPTKTFRERLPLARDPATMLLTPVSLGPSVVQYFPRAGKVRASVKLVYNNDSKEVSLADEPEPTINPSSDFAVYKILAEAEVASWVIAAIVAIATGLSTFYYKGTSWGTFQDYLTLLLWGIGVDQGKNFLQALQAYSAPAGNPHALAH